MGDRWQAIADGTTIGYKRILRFPNIKTKSFRLTIAGAKGAPLLSEVNFYRAPTLLVPPQIIRETNGRVTLSSKVDGLALYYTTDGSLPTVNSTRYTNPILVDKPTTIKAIGFDEDTQKASEVVSRFYDIPKGGWRLLPSHIAWPKRCERLSMRISPPTGRPRPMEVGRGPWHLIWEAYRLLRLYLLA